MNRSTVCVLLGLALTGLSAPMVSAQQVPSSAWPSTPQIATYAGGARTVGGGGVMSDETTTAPVVPLASTMTADDLGAAFGGPENRVAMLAPGESWRPVWIGAVLGAVAGATAYHLSRGVCEGQDLYCEREGPPEPFLYVAFSGIGAVFGALIGGAVRAW